MLWLRSGLASGLSWGLPAVLRTSHSHCSQSRQSHLAASSSYCGRSARPSVYGLFVHFQLLPTSPRGDAVTFSYRRLAPPGKGLSPSCTRLLPSARARRLPLFTPVKKERSKQLRLSLAIGREAV